MSKQHKARLVILALGAFLVVTACVVTDLVGDLGGGGGGGASGEILFQDDFSDTGSGWDQYSDSDGSTDYYDGGYRIFINTSRQLFWANPYRSFTDVRVEVDADLIGGSEDNSFGVICRYEDIDNFYALVISSDGYYGIRKRINGGDLEVIGSDALQFSDSINLSGARNHITAECIGSTLSLYANGDLLISVTDSDNSSGDVGLIASTFDVSSTDILFDNFTVYAP